MILTSFGTTLAYVEFWRLAPEQGRFDRKSGSEQPPHAERLPSYIQNKLGPRQCVRATGIRSERPFNRMGDTYVLCTLYCRYSVTRRTVSKKRIRRNSPGAMAIFVIYPSTCIEVCRFVIVYRMERKRDHPNAREKQLWSA